MPEEPKDTTTLPSIIGSAIDSIRPSIKSNFIKAVDRLSGAVIDLPAAYLEGMANEIRANSQARVAITQSIGSSISASIDVPTGMGEIALRRHAGKILREQHNVDQVIRGAADKLNNNHKDEPPSDTEISDDWLSAFEREASTKSSPEMREIFSRILAGEINRPNTFSIKTIRTISQIDQQTADIFQKLRNILISQNTSSFTGHSIAPTFGRDPMQNGMKDFGVSFSGINLLIEHGLLATNCHATMEYNGCIPIENTIAFSALYANENWILRPINPTATRSSMRIEGLVLSAAGEELAKVVDAIPDANYTNTLISHFSTLGYHFERIQNPA